MAETDQTSAASVFGLHQRLARVASRIFGIIADCFPVAAASDEYGYFPQVLNPRTRWDSWDRFSQDGVQDAVEKLRAEASALNQLLLENGAAESVDSKALVDISLVLDSVQTLIEQLAVVRGWEIQPTWHLTVACVGLAEALESGEPEAARRRAVGLAGFIDQACSALQHVPALFRDLGLQMVAGTRGFLAGLQPKLPELAAAQEALDRFEDALSSRSVRARFQLPGELFERVVKSHLQLRFDLRELEALLDQEIREMREMLEEIAGAPLTAAGLEKAIERSPLPRLDDRGLLGLYEREVARLARHCVGKGLVEEKLVLQCPVRVKPVPSYLSAIRSASSYSIPARHPPIGGVFFVINAGQPEEFRKSYQREYRILAAHETYPGHHLLDMHRWSLSDTIRRVVERPLFYEGWACFAEELLWLTGYLHTPTDRLLLARRRLWRAIRGQVDLGLQTGRLDLPAAARRLAETGMSAPDALSAVRKYPLNPGYQSCYTAGVRRFLDLYQRYGKINLPAFTAAILHQGEISFEHLENVFARRRRERSGTGIG